MGRIVILCFTFLVISSSLSAYLKIYSVYTQRSSKSIDSFYHDIYVVNSLVHVLCKQRQMRLQSKHWFLRFASAKCTFKNETARGCFIIIQDKNVLNKCWITWHLTQSETSSWEVLSYCREAEALHSGNVHLLYKEQRQSKTKGRKIYGKKIPEKMQKLYIIYK